MAFNFSIFKVRAASAVVFSILMVGGIIWNQWSFFVLFTVIQLGCLFEFQKLMRLISPKYASISKVHQWGVLLLGTAVMFALSTPDFVVKDIVFAKAGIYGFAGIAVFIILYDLLTKQIDFNAIAISILGIVYISMGLSLFFQLRFLMSQSFFGDLGYAFPLLVLVSIWVNDTAAYLVGSVIGRTPLSPISPNKTWEGTVAGVVIAVFLVTVVMGKFIPVNQKAIFVVSLVSALVGTVGDLVESKLKRLANVKDSGKMMPGHGGFLDRFDSILLAVPFVWLILQLLF